MKILLTGGGSGGHVFPIIAVVREIRRAFPQKKIRFFYLGPRDSFSRILLSQEDIKVKTVLSGKIRRYSGLKAIALNIIDILFKMPLGFIQAFFYIFFLAPDVVFSKSGYGAFSSTVMSWVFGVPIYLHESDAAAGITSQMLSRLAYKTFVSFENTGLAPSKTILIGNPIRQELLSGSKEKAIKLFNIKTKKPVILVLGGSQGAKRINSLILEILPQLLEEFEVIHQVGDKNVQSVRLETEALLADELRSKYHFFGFLSEEYLRHAYAISELVISRAGSGIIFELAGLTKPSMLIPLPESAQNHQLKNAYIYSNNGAAMIFEESNISPRFFLERLRYLMSHAEEMEKMKKSALKFSRPDAAKVLAREIVKSGL